MLLHRSDLPRLPQALPRALSPDVDRDLMAAVNRLDDVAGSCAIRILRGTGMRLGELLDLELDCVLDFAGRGSWIRVPLGKLNTERTVPLDDDTLAALDEWTSRRGRQRSLPNPRTGRPADFLFVIGGRRMGVPPGSVAASTTPSGQPGSPTPPAGPVTSRPTSCATPTAPPSSTAG